MRFVTLTTWNVLHRIHAENWNETPLRHFPSETERIEGIAREVRSMLAAADAVVCLQEVSGDQLAAIRAAVPDAQVVTHRFPRLPALRSGAPCPLNDPWEFLVVLSRQPLRLLDSDTSRDDPGKGFLHVDAAGGLTVISTHVSFDSRRVAQLATLKAVSTPRCLIAGDFNVAPGIVAQAMGEDFRITSLDAPTREGKNLVIDHVLVRGGELTDAKVLPTGPLSDHFPVQVQAGFA